MTRITRAQIDETLQAGDLIIVHYLHGGVVAAGIQWWTHGHASHVLNSLGGNSIVEEDIGGASHGYLDTYLYGQCRLTIKRILPHLSPVEKNRVVSYWLGLVGQPYGWRSVVASFFAVPIRRYLLPRFPGPARFALRVVSRVVGHGQPDCSASWVMGVRRPRPRLLAGYDAEDVTPETLLRDAKLLPVAVWDAPVLVKETHHHG